jgi:hypothetical protein
MPARLSQESYVSNKQAKIDAIFDENKASKGVNKVLGIESHRLPIDYEGSSRFEYLYNEIPVFVKADKTNTDDGFRVITSKAEKYAEESEKLNQRIKALGKKLTELGDSFVMKALGELTASLFGFKEPGKPLLTSDKNVVQLALMIQNVYGWGEPESLQYAIYLAHFSALPSIIRNLPEKSIDRNMATIKLGLIGTYGRLHVKIETKIKDPSFNFGDPIGGGGISSSSSKAVEITEPVKQ